jgi:CheY-like chemotaxis protein
MPAPPPVLRVTSAPRSRRVLIVEDNIDAADLLGALVKSLGHETKVVYDAEQAHPVRQRAQWYASSQPACLSMALALHVKSRFALGTQYRQLHHGPQLQAFMKPAQDDVQSAQFVSRYGPIMRLFQSTLKQPSYQVIHSGQYQPFMPSARSQPQPCGGALDEPDESGFHVQPGQHNVTCGAPRSAEILPIEP